MLFCEGCGAGIHLHKGSFVDMTGGDCCGDDGVHTPDNTKESQYDDIDQAFDNMTVYDPDDANGGPNPLPGWWRVMDESGTIAYLPTERAAYRYRLAEINRRMNG